MNKSVRSQVDFSDRLNELMIIREIKPEQLAEAAGVSLVTVHNWKKNKKSIRLKNLLILADYFQCSLDYLAGRSDKVLEYAPMPCLPFSKRIRKVMKERGISTYKLRKISRFDGKYFEVWDRGADPTVITLTELADLFECSIDYLTGRER